jgi:zinc D-Ala-D-Ala carboxypeptidase
MVILVDLTFALSKLGELAIALLPLLTLYVRKFTADYTQKDTQDLETIQRSALTEPPDEEFDGEEWVDNGGAGQSLSLASTDPLYGRYFHLSDLTNSETALRKRLDNTPGENEKKSLEALAVNVLDILKDKYPSMRINSGFRAEKVNFAVGGAKNSQHLTGEAADLSFPGNSLVSVWKWIRDESGMEYDQLILEHNRWVHISYAATRKNRRQAFVIK